MPKGEKGEDVVGAKLVFRGSRVLDRDPAQTQGGTVSEEKVSGRECQGVGSREKGGGRAEERSRQGRSAG